MWCPRRCRAPIVFPTSLTSHRPLLLALSCKASATLFAQVSPTPTATVRINGIHSFCQGGDCSFSFNDTLTPVVASLEVAHTNEWHLAPAGAHACDAGSTAAQSKCEAAAKQLAALAGKIPGRPISVGRGGTCLDGNWGQVPLGCSAQSGAGGDGTAHYKTAGDTGAGCISKMYQLICSGPAVATTGTHLSDTPNLTPAGTHMNTPCATMPAAPTTLHPSLGVPPHPPPPRLMPLTDGPFVFAVSFPLSLAVF